MVKLITTQIGVTATSRRQDIDVRLNRKHQRTFVGHVVGIGDDIVSFHGDTDEELQDAFEGVLDHYLEVKGRPENPPQKHFAWRFLARLRQAFHL